MMKKLIAALALSVLLAGTSMASPTIFSDNFDSYAYALNWGGGGVWSVTGGPSISLATGHLTPIFQWATASTLTSTAMVSPVCSPLRRRLL